MTPSPELCAPATMARPRTSSALASREPTIEVFATTTSPADKAKSTMNSSGRLPSVDWRTPVIAGPKRSPTASVAIEITHASPARARAATRNVTTGSASAKCRTPAASVARKAPARTPLRSDKPHSLVHRGQGRRRLLARLLRPRGEQPAQLVRICAQLDVALTDRLQQRDHGLADVLLEPAVAVPVVASLDRVDRLAGRHVHDLDQVRDTGLPLRVVDDVAPGVGDRRAELLRDRLGRVEDPDRPLGRPAGRGHLPVRLLQVHDPRPDLGVDALGQHEGLAEARVEPLGDVARQLQVLALVVADRDLVRLVEQDVAGHQDGVGEQRGADEVLLVDLVLELRHPTQLAVARDRAE